MPLFGDWVLPMGITDDCTEKGQTKIDKESGSKTKAVIIWCKTAKKESSWVLF